MNQNFTPYWVMDPGHGWLAVPLKHVIELDIWREISDFSYFCPKKCIVYLEEDCDAGLYLVRFQLMPRNFKVKQICKTKESSVRKLPSAWYLKHAIEQVNQAKNMISV